MRKRTIQKLTMLALIVMASIPAFAQGGKFGSETNAGVATTIGDNVVAGDVFDLQELRYYVKSIEDGVLDLEVIGLSSQIAGATGDPSLLTSKWEGTVTIPHKLSAADVDRAAEISSIAANAFTTTVLYPTTEGGKNATDSKDNFTAAAALVTKIIIDYNAEATVVAGIGANAFAGLTALTEVTSLSPTPPTCPAGAFASSVKTLIVPEGSKVMGLYAKPNSGAWRKISTIKNTAGLMFGDVDKSKRLNGTDITILNKVIAKQATSNDACDTDGSGRLNGTDVSVLNNEIAKKYRQ
jgi:hypothetical protein